MKLHRLAAVVSTRASRVRDRYQERLRERHGDEGMETIEVVVLSVIGLLVAVVLGAAIKAVVESYQADLVKQ